MEFREFFEEQEKMDESLLGLAKSGWGIAKGIGNTYAGAMTMGDEALAKMVGQGSKGRFGRGSGQFKRGIRQIFIGDPPKTEPGQDAPPPAQQENPPQQNATETQPRQEEEKFSIRCPNGHRLISPTRFAGRKTQCPKCSQTFRIPDPMERPQPQRQDAQGRPLLQGEPKPNKKYADLSMNYEKAKSNNNQSVMRHIQYLMSLADPVYYHYALQQGYFPRRSKA